MHWPTLCHGICQLLGNIEIHSHCPHWACKIRERTALVDYYCPTEGSERHNRDFNCILGSGNAYVQQWPLHWLLREKEGIINESQEGDRWTVRVEKKKPDMFEDPNIRERKRACRCDETEEKMEKAQATQGLAGQDADGGFYPRLFSKKF